MDIGVTGKNLEIQPNVRDYVIRKLEKINRHLPKVFAFEVEISEEKTRSPEQRYVVQVTIDNNGTLLRGEERGQDVMTAVDRVAVVMGRQVERFKGKLYDKGRGISPIRGKSPIHPEAAPPEIESEVSPETLVGKVVRRKRFEIKPMSLNEATEQMELLGHDFFLFTNSDTNEINLIYRRKDGNYGVIEAPCKRT